MWCQACKLCLTEDCSGYKKIGSSTPVALQINIGSLVFLTAADLEDHLGT